MSKFIGLLLSLLSAAAFGTSGALAKGLIEAGWSPGAAVTARVSLGAVALLVPAALAMRGRWNAIERGGVRSVVVMGVVAVAGCQLAYFQAVERLSVGVALLLEFTGVLLVVLWHWFRRGTAPRALTVVGTVLALFGLGLVLDVLGGLTVDPIGVLWGLAAAFGLATYFVVSEDISHGLPPLVVAAGGLSVGAVVLAIAGLLGVLELSWPMTQVQLAGATAPWWMVVIALALVATALAYATGISAVRTLGSKVGSFVGLAEVIFAVLWAWLLLAEVPAPVQLAGGALIVAGVVAVRLDSERGPSAEAPTA